MDTDKLRELCVRLIGWSFSYQNAEKADMNDLEIIKDDLKNEFKQLMED